MTNHTEKQEEKIVKIIKVFKGGSGVENEKIVSRFTHNAELKNKQLKKLMKIGEITLKRSGVGIRVTLVSHDFIG